MGAGIVGTKVESVHEGCDDYQLDALDADHKMSADKFDDGMAVLTLTATVITIALGFLLNL